MQNVDPKFLYDTIRKEILDQKRCQFQIFSMTVAGTALILAYAVGSRAMSLVYLAPMVMNDLSLIIFLEKAISVQRKVGYLQMMEQHLEEYVWLWETQLEDFRAKVPLRSSTPPDPARKYKYLTLVGLMLVGLNLLTALLFWLHLGVPDGVGAPWEVWAVRTLSVALFLLGPIALVWYRNSLIGGRNSGPAIRKTWEEVLKQYSSSARRKPAA
jgi:hypothetical protein